MAAREGKLNVFTFDKPPALYFLIKMGIQDRFNVTKSLCSGELNSALRKGQQTLLEKVESGLALISKAEYEEIEQRWYGAQIGMKPEILQPTPATKMKIFAEMANGSGLTRSTWTETLPFGIAPQNAFRVISETKCSETTPSGVGFILIQRTAQASF
jgi:hypothetical protein